MSTTPFITPGRICISLVALSSSISCFVADWSETHVFNPRWPPHAKFHNGQTMSMGLCLGLLSAYFTWRKTTNYKDSIWTAALIGSVYWLTGLSAILYPGSHWLDPEFRKDDSSEAPQAPAFVLHFVIVWIGYALEIMRLNKQKNA